MTDAAGEPVRVVGAGRRADRAQRAGRPRRGPLVGRRADRARPTAIALAVRGRGERPAGDGPGPAARRLGAAVVGRSRAALVTAGSVRMHSVAGRDGPRRRVGHADRGSPDVFGTGAAGCGSPRGAQANLANSVVWGFQTGVPGAATIDALAPARERRRPRASSRPGDLGCDADSPLVDAGDPRPLDADEPELDALGDVRAIDGDGDGTARRDLGALERRPPPPPVDGRQPARQPRRRAGHAGRGRHRVRRRRRAGGAAAASRASATAPWSAWWRSRRSTSRVDARRRRRVLRRRARRARRPPPRWSTSPAGRRRSTRACGRRRCGCRRCSAASGRATTARSSRRAFRGPSGAGSAGLSLDTVTAAERGNATMLMARLASAPVPRLTRSIAVTVRVGAPGGTLQRRLRRRHRARAARSRRCRACRRGAPARGGRSAACRCSHAACASRAGARACGSAARRRRCAAAPASSRSRGGGSWSSAAARSRCGRASRSACGSRCRDASGAAAAAAAAATSTPRCATPRGSRARVDRAGPYRPPLVHCAAGRRRRQHADPSRDVPRRRAARALALRHRARLDGRRARARRCATCSACAGSMFDLIDASIVSSTVPQLAPEWSAMAERYLGHRMPVVGPGLQDRAWRSGSTTRARSAPTGWSTRSRRTTASAGRAWWSTSGPASTSTSSRARASTSAA